MKKALILIDFENEWRNKKSEEYLGDLKSLLSKTNQLIDFCRSNGYKIIFTRHVEGNENWSEKSKGTKIIEELHKQNTDTVLTKHRISPFYKTTLERELKEVKEIVVCGILTNLCVRSTVQDAYDRGFDITVVKDCCQTYDKKTHDFTINDLKATRPDIRFLNINEFVI
ncbi:MAG TPA: isochorismatase family cysteine hydrolase [archaeon]|nr:isochorismatase family cysteine hydrolase [archaeon]